MALGLDDDGLQFDTALCNGCGHCVPACPRMAIGLTPLPVNHCDIKADANAFAHCREVSAQGLACQHALGVRDLDALARCGVRRLTMLTGECSRCDKAPKGSGLHDAAARHRRVQESRNLPVVTLESRPFEPGGPSFPPLPPAMVSVDRSRRRFLAPFLGRRAVPASQNESVRLAYYAPKIDEARCTACDACARICPDHAIARQEAPETGYRLVPDHCSGCGLCVDICERDAVTIHALAPAAESFLRLETRRCQACGVPFSTPAGFAPVPADSTGKDPALCPICSQHPHSRNLYQVIRKP